MGLCHLQQSAEESAGTAWAKLPEIMCICVRDLCIISARVIHSRVKLILRGELSHQSISSVCFKMQKRHHALSYVVVLGKRWVRHTELSFRLPIF